MKHIIIIIITTMYVGIIQAQTISQQRATAKQNRVYNIQQIEPIKANMPRGFYDSPSSAEQINMDSEFQNSFGTSNIFINKLDSDNAFGFSNQFVGSILGESINTDANLNLYAIRPFKLETDFDDISANCFLKAKSDNHLIENIQIFSENNINNSIMKTSTSNNSMGDYNPAIPYLACINTNVSGFELRIIPNKKFTNASIKLYNTSGKIVVQKVNFKGDSFSCNLTEYTEGFYWLEISENDNICIQKVWKVKE